LHNRGGSCVCPPCSPLPYRAVPFPSPPETTGSGIPTALLALAYATAYYLAGRLGQVLSLPDGPDVPFWVPSSLYLVGAIVVPYRLWPLLSATILPVNLLLDLPSGMPLSLSLMLFAVDTCEAYLGASLLRRFGGKPFRIQGRGHLFIFILIGAFLAPMVGAAVGSYVFYLEGLTHTYMATAWYWWLGECAPILTIGPFILSVLSPDERAFFRNVSRKRLMEASSVYVILVAGCIYIAKSSMGIESSAKYWLMPLLVWSGLRFGLLGATLANITLTLLLGYIAMHHHDIDMAPELRAGEFQINFHTFLIISSGMSMLSAVVVREGEALLDRLRLEIVRNKTIFETSPDGSHILDQDGYLVDYNEAFRRTLGYTAEKLRGMHVSQWDLRWTREELVPVIRKNIETGAVFETRHRCKDGTAVDLEITTAGIDFQGQRCLYCCSRNLTERKALESRLRQSQKLEAIGRLAGGVAHDFNNLLTGIGLRLDLAQQSRTLSGENEDMVIEIREITNRAAGVVEQLLLFARQHPMRTVDVNLHALVDSSAKLVERTIGEHITLSLRHPVGDVWVHADPNMIDQVIVNLCLNARDAMPKGGLLTLETGKVLLSRDAVPEHASQHAGPFAVLHVSDTGAGIPDEALPRLFEPFYTTKKAGEGTGLGLATVYSIAQQHGGWVSVRSDVDKGSTFSVYLPATLPKAAEAAPAAAPAKLAPGAGRILLVEDELAVRTVIATLLRRLGYTVTIASNGNEALRLWQEASGAFDLLLTDTVMPGGLDGLELAQKVRAERPGLPVIVMSGYTDKILNSDVLKTSGYGFLAKPFEAHTLTDAIARRLSARA
jgi:PAS domain S-box-containing protein